MSTQNLRTLSLTLSHRIHQSEIPRWRGALLELIGWENELFHNHSNKGYDGNGSYTSTEAKASKNHHRYPLIQYYEQHGKGRIMGINEGVTALLKVLDEKDLKINWDGRKMDLKIEDIQHKEHTFQMLQQPKTYHLKRWLALTQRNHQQWTSCTNLVQRVELLDRLLANHLIGLFKSVNWNWPSRLEANLQFLHQIEKVRFKGMGINAFDITFTANVELPIGIGIGKGVSHGFGSVGIGELGVANSPRRKRKR